MDLLKENKALLIELCGALKQAQAIKAEMKSDNSEAGAIARAISYVNARITFLENRPKAKPAKE